jgi:hypothetical protein
MDYLEEFKKNCEMSLKGKVVIPFDAATKTQRETEFDRELKNIILIIKDELEKHKETYLNIASKNNYKEISDLRFDMKNLIRDFLRKFRDSQL